MNVLRKSSKYKLDTYRFEIERVGLLSEGKNFEKTVTTASPMMLGQPVRTTNQGVRGSFRSKKGMTRSSVNKDASVKEKTKTVPSEVDSQEEVAHSHEKDGAFPQIPKKTDRAELQGRKRPRGFSLLIHSCFRK